MSAVRPPRRRAAAVLCLSLACALTAAACGHDGSSEASAKPIKIGLLLTLSGAYSSIGADVRDGFELYLSHHGSELGGHQVQLSLDDEGDAGSRAAAAVKNLLNSGVQAVVGPVDGASFSTVVPQTTAAKIPLIGVSARPDLTDIGYVWNVSAMPSDPGAAIAPYMATHIKGPVFAIGTDYPGGWEQMRGFTDNFTSLGGVLANPKGRTLFTQNTTDFSQAFDAIKSSGAKAIYCSYSGQEAVQFVTQWAKSDVHDIPLYAPGFLTEGLLLKQEGQAAVGITSVLDYSPDVDTAANRVFVSAWAATHNGDQPTVFALTGYDAAALLDQAIDHAGPDPDSTAINTAIGTLGRIDSPRGAWQMAAATHAPVQKWYLRKVATDGTALANVEIEELATLPD